MQPLDATRKVTSWDYTSAEQMAQAWGADYGVTKFAQLYDKGASVADQRAAERAEQDKKSIADNFSDEIKAYHDHAAVKVMTLRCSHAVRRINPLLIL